MDEFMRAALEQARLGAEEGGVPIGAALAMDGALVAVGRNRRLQDSAPVMHAEINCLYNAGKVVPNFRGAALYTTLMPCHMCAGAAAQFGIAKVVAAESETSSEGAAFMRAYGIEVVDLNLPEAKRLLGAFIQANPERWTFTARAGGT